RRHPFPAWLARLDEIRPVRAVQMGHLLGDGENIALGVDLPAGEMTVLVYVDHNMGTVVKDAFVIDRPIAEVVGQLDSLSAESAGETFTRELTLADARAKIDEAVQFGRITYPPFETETWPAVRPLVEWLLSLMPAGGEGYEADEVDSDQIEALTGRVMASPHARGLRRGRDSDDADIVETLLWLAAQQLGGDPLRWSPVTVEIVLLDLIPRKIVADAAYLRRVPAVMRHVVAFAHAERGIPKHLTADTMAAVEEFESQYLEEISTPRRQGPEALLERMGVLPPLDGDTAGDEESPSLADADYSFFLELMENVVGGRAAMTSLDDTPLPDEPLDLSDVPGDVHDRVRGVGARVDEAVAALFSEHAVSPELRTAARRILARIAAADSAIFRRKASDTGAAAAVLWIAGSVNDVFSASRSGVTVGAMMAAFGLKGSPSQRAQPMLRALGVPVPQEWDRTLGDRGLLVSAERRELRERWESLREMG
ncbi:MAG: hypothetical protein CMJ89_20615, partial [Planctomycetes bacterium]|nr:hypothetical protein [Planctomycetota bacterium]